MKHKWATRILSKVITITSYFNQSHAFKAKIKEEASRSNITKETLDSVAPTRSVMAVNKDSLPIKIITIVTQRSFFNEIKALYSILKPLAYVITLIQAS